MEDSSSVRTQLTLTAKKIIRSRPKKRNIFYQSASKFLPFLKKENIHPDMSGIRPKLQGPDDDFRDFVIKEDYSRISSIWSASNRRA